MREHLRLYFQKGKRYPNPVTGQSSAAEGRVSVGFVNVDIHGSEALRSARSADSIG